jgi:hypothetical protein
MEVGGMMLVKDLIKELKKFDKDSEVEFVNCWSETCPCAQEGGGICDSKNCEWTVFDISHIDTIEKEKDEEHDRVCAYIDPWDGWSYNSDGELIKEN